MTSYPIRWNGVRTDYVAISTSVHTFVRMYECVCVWQQNEVRKEKHMTNLALLLHKSASREANFSQAAVRIDGDGAIKLQLGRAYT